MLHSALVSGRHVAFWIACCCLMPTLGYGDAINDDLKAVRAVGREGAGFDAARTAANRLRKLSTDQLPVLLDGFADANPLAQNWLRGIINDVARRQPKLPVPTLVSYVKDVKRPADGRAFALELIGRVDTATQQQIIDSSLEDPSLAIRAQAVTSAIARARKAKDSSKEQAIKEFQTALDAARHPGQINDIIAALKELEVIVRPVDQLRIITKWRTIAPFDNVGGAGFAKVYPPEEQFTTKGMLDFSKEVPGKAGKVSWREEISDSDDGSVDLAKIYSKEKGAVCYAFTELFVNQAQAAQVRLGTSAASKIWVNGKEVASNEVYHAGSMVDQYIADVQLKAGSNQILIKLCQNEQTESWAQDWAFQFRVTDLTGRGLVSEP